MKVEGLLGAKVLRRIVVHWHILLRAWRENMGMLDSQA